MVGMALAFEAPERVDRLVLCCTAAYLGPPEGWHDRARLVRAGGTAAIAERVLERWFTQRFRDESPATVGRFREMLEATPSDGYAACCEAIASWDARTSLGAIHVPTLVIAGADDVATPPEDGGFLAESIPAAELVILPGAAHLANVEQPEAFNQALLGHLSVPKDTEEAAA
jgi:3-oxoadipate enol-lactonase